jgi:hypothetical protein
MNDDERLGRAFEALRREDTRRAPAFGAMWAKKAPPRSASPWRVLIPVASALTAAAALLLWCRAGTQSPAATAAASAPPPSGASSLPAFAASDQAPLDFLLHLPGEAALARVPQFRVPELHASTPLGGTPR